MGLRGMRLNMIEEVKLLRIEIPRLLVLRIFVMFNIHCWVVRACVRIGHRSNSLPKHIHC